MLLRFFLLRLLCLRLLSFFLFLMGSICRLLCIYLLCSRLGIFLYPCPFLPRFSLLFLLILDWLFGRCRSYLRFCRNAFFIDLGFFYCRNI